MSDSVHHKRQALLAGIQGPYVRAKRQSAEATGEVMHQYDQILGLIECLNPILSEYIEELNIFYFPVDSQKLLCVYRTADQSQPVPVRLKAYLTDARRRAGEVFSLIEKARWRSFDYQPRNGAELHCNDRSGNDILNLIRVTLGGHLPRSYPQGATALVVCCPIPVELRTASWRDLAGILVLFGSKQDFPKDSHSRVADGIRREFDHYMERTGRYVIRELEFFLSSLMSQDERIQDNALRAVGVAVYMLLHRFRNFRQAGESLITNFATVQDVTKHPDDYRKTIESMRSQLEKAKKLEKQLAYIGQKPQSTRRSVSEVVDIFKVVFKRATEAANSSAFLDEDVPQELLNDYLHAPTSSEILEEVFNNHIENIIRELDQPNVSNKTVTLRAYQDVVDDYVCLDIIHYGPPLPPEVLEDLQRAIRVRRPSGSGLGMYLSAMILRHVGGDQQVTSPISGSNTGVCVTLKFPRRSK